MGYRLDDFDRSILEFRPKIAFVEPDQKPGEIEGIDYPQIEDVQDAREKIKRLANAVNVLAGAVQARVDSKAKDMFISLDPTVDQDAIQAMKRRYPGADPTKITYDQYRECKNGLRAHGEEVAKQAIVTPEQVAKARDDLYAGGLIGTNAPGSNRSALLRTGGVTPQTTGAGIGVGTGADRFGLRSTGLGKGLGDKNQDNNEDTDPPADRTGVGPGGNKRPGFGGYDKADAGSGGFRPELNTSGQIIQPMDVEKMQVDLICILVNYIWKNYIKAILINLPFPVGPPMRLLPDQLCDPGFDYELPGLLLLGDEPDDLLSGKAAAQAVQELVADVANITGEENT